MIEDFKMVSRKSKIAVIVMLILSVLFAVSCFHGQASDSFIESMQDMSDTHINHYVTYLKTVEVKEENYEHIEQLLGYERGKFSGASPQAVKMLVDQKILAIKACQYEIRENYSLIEGE